MATKIKITAVCGWALPTDWFRQLVESYFPRAEVRACYPMNPEDEEEAAAHLVPQTDWVIGYSLGSLWLLYHKGKIPAGTRVVLMAPILAFPAEKQLGGKTPVGKLKYQKKILNASEDYAAALKGFFDLSGIRLPENDLREPYDRDILVRGLDFLETATVSPQAADGCTAISGLRDPLLDGNRLKELIPHLNLVEGCDHSPHKLLSFLAQLDPGLNEPSAPHIQPLFPQRAS
jgi:hypothetical protein